MSERGLQPLSTSARSARPGRRPFRSCPPFMFLLLQSCGADCELVKDVGDSLLGDVSGRAQRGSRCNAPLRDGAAVEHLPEDSCRLWQQRAVAPVQNHAVVANEVEDI